MNTIHNRPLPEGRTSLFQSRVLWIFLLLFIGKAAFLGLSLIPRWEIADESGHFSYIQDIASGKGIPVLHESLITPFFLKDLGLGYYPESNWIAQHPPLYYLVMAPVYWLANKFGSTPVVPFYVCRFFSGLFGAIVLLFIYHIVTQLV